MCNSNSSSRNFFATDRAHYKSQSIKIQSCVSQYQKNTSSKRVLHQSPREHCAEVAEYDQGVCYETVSHSNVRSYICKVMPTRLPKPELHKDNKNSCAKVYMGKTRKSQHYTKTIGNLKILKMGDKSSEEDILSDSKLIQRKKCSMTYKNILKNGIQKNI